MTEKCYISRPFTAQHAFTSGIEGPACDQEGNLYAVNYARRHTVGKVTPAGVGSLFLELDESSTGCGMRFNRDGDMLIADHTGHNILKVNMRTKEIAVYAHEPLMNQPNDLAIAADGVLFASDPDWKTSTGQLWKIHTDGEVSLLEADMGTTNGIEISPDEKTLFVNETVQRKIWAYDLSDSKEIGNKRLFIEFPDFGMDGMRCDMAGNLYVTRIGKGCIAQINPWGEVVREIPLHGKNCTNLTFGGADGRTCYVTMADRGNIEFFRSEFPGRCWSLFR